MEIKQKTRGKVVRKRRPMMLIQVEGKNKTERIYFNNFNKRTGYNIEFTKGNYTDPVNMAKNLLNEIKTRELNIKDNDKAYCIFDTDVDNQKQLQIDQAYSLIKSNKMIDIIKSNPCFEIWFLLHFKYTSKVFSSNNEVIKELEKFIPNYEKNKNYCSVLEDKINNAVKNASKLEKEHEKLDRNITNMNCNPSTDVYKVIEEIKKQEK